MSRYLPGSTNFKYEGAIPTQATSVGTTATGQTRSGVKYTKPTPPSRPGPRRQTPKAPVAPKPAVNSESPEMAEFFRQTIEGLTDSLRTPNKNSAATPAVAPVDFSTVQATPGSLEVARMVVGNIYGTRLGDNFHGQVKSEIPDVKQTPRSFLSSKRDPSLSQQRQSCPLLPTVTSL